MFPVGVSGAVQGLPCMRGDYCSGRQLEVPNTASRACTVHIISVWIAATRLVTRHDILRMRIYRIPSRDHLLVCGQCMLR